MRKSFLYLALGVAGAAALLTAAWMMVGGQADLPAKERVTSSEQGKPQGRLTIEYPLDGALFPPDIAPPTFRWRESRERSDLWLGTIEFSDGGEPMRFRASSRQWTPADEQWEIIKRRSLERPATATFTGVSGAEPERILLQASISISTSEDEVGAPVFFREVNLPFLTAVKDPAAHIRWRFGSISSKEPPPIVLEKLPVCGNCHSFSADGTTLAMEIDSGNDKGSYAIAPVEEEIVLEGEKIITWSDYRREDGEKTFGLLCQASPDGRYVVGTVKDRAVAVYRPDLAFSQLFFLVKGILAIYDRQEKTFRAFPGADDRRYVHTNATWSPDGKTLVYARSHGEVYDPPGLRDVQTIVLQHDLAADFTERGRKFRYDLYRIPFNDGKGGKAEPIEGASNNGMSNYFPKFSPDGKWIVFCKADSFMLLQPDSELYIIPAAGGEPRRLRCNLGRMNSWHSWSPNGRWLVFSSKAFSIYTQLFLTHVDEQGRSTPPVRLENFTEANRAANIPEFANTSPQAIKRIVAHFLDELSYYRTAYQRFIQDDFAGAVEYYRKALEINSDYADARFELGRSLLALGQLPEAESCFNKVIELKPDNAAAHHNLGLVLARQGKLQPALEACREAARLDRGDFQANKTLGMILLDLGEVEESGKYLARALLLDPREPFALYYYGMALERGGNAEEAVDFYYRALNENPDLREALLSLASIRMTSGSPELRNGEEAVQLAGRACALTGNRDPLALTILSAALAETGRFADAVDAANVALRAARAAGAVELINTLEQQLLSYRQAMSAPLGNRPVAPSPPEDELR